MAPSARMQGAWKRSRTPPDCPVDTANTRGADDRDGDAHTEPRRRGAGRGGAGSRDGRRRRRLLVIADPLLLSTGKIQERGSAPAIATPLWRESSPSSSRHSAARVGPLRMKGRSPKGLPDWIFWNWPLAAAKNVFDMGASSRDRGEVYIRYGV